MVIDLEARRSQANERKVRDWIAQDMNSMNVIVQTALSLAGSEQGAVGLLRHAGDCLSLDLP